MKSKLDKSQELTFDEAGMPVVEGLPHTRAVDLLSQGIQAGADVEAIQKLAELYWKEEERNAEKAIRLQLSAFQKEMAPIRHNRAADIATRTGANYGYTYATLDELDRQCTPLLAQYGLSKTWDSKLEGGMLTVTCTLHHDMGASMSSSFSCPIDSSAKMSGAQKAGAAQTYAKRQSLIAVLGITTAEDDTDGVEPGDVEPITSEQYQNLQEWMDACGEKFRKEKFYTWLGVEALADLPRAKFDMALKALQAAHEKSRQA